MDQITLVRVIEKIHQLTGITISEHKKAMLQSRLKKRMRKVGVDTYEGYMVFLNKNKDEVQLFINAVTTNETSFFRTPGIWEYFQLQFLPEWHKKNPKQQLQIWSAAASSGEEAFSLAMCCQEFQVRNPGFSYRIVATDISTEVLDEARKGAFPLRSVEFLQKKQPQLFEQYFTAQKEETFSIRADLKDKIFFGTHNLFTVKKEQFDIVFLRNVLIYFSGEDQETVLKNVAQSLAKENILIIGESESLNRLQTPFEFKQACIYGKKE